MPKKPKTKEPYEQLCEEIAELRGQLTEIVEHVKSHLPDARTKAQRFSQLVGECRAFVEEQEEIGADPQRMADWLRPILCFDKRNEVFAVLYLDARCKLLDMSVTPMGPTGGEMLVAPILRQAVKLDAAYVLTAHSHPSEGNPSEGDLDFHTNVGSQLDLVGVRYLDSLIVTNCSARTPSGFCAVSNYVKQPRKKQVKEKQQWASPQTAATPANRNDSSSTTSR